MWFIGAAEYHFQSMEHALELVKTRLCVDSRHEAIFMLLLLSLETDVLERQVPMGRMLLEALMIHGTEDEDRKALILREARAALLTNEESTRSFWDGLMNERQSIVRAFHASFHGRKGDVMNNFEQRFEERKQAAASSAKVCFPCLFQIMYPSQARKQVMVDR